MRGIFRTPYAFYCVVMLHALEIHILKIYILKTSGLFLIYALKI